MDGIICINKPQQFTSFDVVAKMRRISGIRKIGHSGTLDPLATGVLPLFIGSATKAITYISGGEKKYIAGFMLGKSTNTQDITGNTIFESDKRVSLNEVLAVKRNFENEIMQTPPMFSAVKVNGQKMYNLARRGIEVERPQKKVTVNYIKVNAYDEQSRTGEMEISCSAGTYVRTIINDIGDLLRCGGTMTSLVRTKSNGFTLNDCYSFEEIEKHGNLEELLKPVSDLFKNLPKIKLDNKQAKMFTNGVKLDFNRVNSEKESGIHAVYDNSRFLGLAYPNESGTLNIEKLFLV